MKSKHKTSLALSQEALRLLGQLAEFNGVSKSAMLEIIIRDRASLHNKAARQRLDAIYGLPEPKTKKREARSRKDG